MQPTSKIDRLVEGMIFYSNHREVYRLERSCGRWELVDIMGRHGGTWGRFAYSERGLLRALQSDWPWEYEDPRPEVECPECGSNFVLEDHYLCEKCREPAETGSPTRLT